MTNGNQAGQISRAFIIITLILSTVALVMQIIGLATNGWWIAYTASFRNSVRLYSFRIDVGLWTVKYCFNGTCDELSNEDFWKKYDIFEYAVITDVTEFRVETCLGVAFMLIVVAIVIALMCFKMSSLFHSTATKVLAAQCTFSVFSAIMSLTAAGRVGRANYDVHNDPLLRSPLLVPYSVYITGVGGILAFLLFVILTIQFVLTLNRSRSEGRGHTVAMDTYPPSYSYPPRDTYPTKLHQKPSDRRHHQNTYY